jgi:hypothetical protein
VRFWAKTLQQNSRERKKMENALEGLIPTIAIVMFSLLVLAMVAVGILGIAKKLANKPLENVTDQKDRYERKLRLLTDAEYNFWRPLHVTLSSATTLLHMTVHFIK